MIYSLSGNLAVKKENIIVIDINGVSYKIFISPKTHQSLPALNQSLQVFTYLHVREDALELFGFLKEADLNFFEKLLTISGIGPRSALGVMAVASVEQLIAAINDGNPELLTKAAGIGRKTAERIILELKGKLAAMKSAEVIKILESDLELQEALVGLGYSQLQAKEAVSKIDPKVKTLEERLKTALRMIKH